MKHCKILFLELMIILLCVTHLFAQAPDTLWTRTYGGEHDDCAYSVRETSDGGFIVVGWTRSFGVGNKDVYLLKIDANGDTLWTRTYGGVNDDEGWSVQETSDGGYIVAGSTESFGAGGSDIYLVKTDMNGDTIWTSTCGLLYYEYGYSVQETSDSGYIVTGRISSFSAGGFDVFLVKFDANGNLLWAKFLGGTGWDVGYSVKETSDGGYIVAGWTMRWGQTWDVYLLKTDGDGDTLWTRTYGGINWDVGYEIQETSDNGFIIVGTTESSGVGCFDIYLIKIDSIGNTLWTKTHGDAGWDECYSVKQTYDGGYIIAGATGSFGAGGFDIYLIRTDVNGNAIWTKTYGGEEWDIGYSVQETSDGGYIIAGKTKSFGSGLYDVYLIKTEPDLGIEEQEPPPKVSCYLRISPNPFTDKVEIELGCTMYDVRCRIKNISLKVYDVSGRLVKSFPLTTNHLSLGTAVSWDGTDDRGKMVSGGVYFLKLTAGKYITTRKLLMIR